MDPRFTHPRSLLGHEAAGAVRLGTHGIGRAVDRDEQNGRCILSAGEELAQVEAGAVWQPHVEQHGVRFQPAGCDKP